MTPQITTLENGLRIVTEDIPHVQTATVGMWVDVGSRYEEAHECGLSHFLEHMAFKGTHTRTASQIAEEVENVGSYLNAYTSREETAYHARVLKEDIPLAVDIIADILQNSTFLEEEVLKERDVIIQEIFQCRDIPDDAVFDHFQSIAFPQQPFGRPILGPEEIIASVTSDNLKAYMNKHYHAASMIFLATGRVDHDQIVDLCREKFTQLSPSSSTSFQKATYKGGRFVDTRPIEQANIVLGYESVPHTHPHYYAQTVLSGIVGGGMSSRLFQEIREKRGLAYATYSFVSPFRDTGLFGIFAGTNPSQVGDVMSVTSDILGTLSATLTEQELARSKAQLKAGLMMGLESTTGRWDQIGHQMTTYGRPLKPEETITHVEAVTLDEIQSIARTLFATPPTLVAVGPGEIDSFLNL